MKLKTAIPLFTGLLIAGCQTPGKISHEPGDLKVTVGTPQKSDPEMALTDDVMQILAAGGLTERDLGGTEIPAGPPVLIAYNGVERPDMAAHALDGKIVFADPQAAGKALGVNGRVEALPVGDKASSIKLSDSKFDLKYDPKRRRLLIARVMPAATATSPAPLVFQQPAQTVPQSAPAGPVERW